MDEGFLLGYNEFRGVKKQIRLGAKDRRRHMYIIGQTGTGKSKLLENLAYQDMMDGKGFAFIPDKRQAIYDYKYLICLENNFHKHFWTEKISDALLGRAVPVYAGCPNVADYFPKQSFIPIDYRDPESAVRTIAQLLDGDSEADYAERRPCLEEARARLFTHYNAPAALARLVRYIHCAPDCLDAELLARVYLGCA